jgi:hypothetical protein
VATEEDVRLGRIAVQRGFATEEQVIDALRVRNKSGGDLGECLVQRGLVPQGELARLREAAKQPAAPSRGRDDVSTDHEISITGTREILARDQLAEALRALPHDPRAALRELKRLAKEFPDTESGVRADREARGLAAKRPELES